jgi:hypothetical protein
MKRITLILAASLTVAFSSAPAWSQSKTPPDTNVRALEAPTDVRAKQGAAMPPATATMHTPTNAQPAPTTPPGPHAQ